MLDMHGFVDLSFQSRPEGDIFLIRSGSGSYDYGNGGAWVAGDPEYAVLPLVNIQPASKKSADIVMAMGGTANPADLRDVYINDGTMIFPADTGRDADVLQFHDGLDLRRWRVVNSDCRPWRNYCHAIVERTRKEVDMPIVYLASDGGVYTDSSGATLTEPSE